MLSFFKKRKLSPEQVIADSLGDFDLPQFHAAVMTTLKLLRHPDSSFPEIASSIEVNPALVIKVLRTVNSAAFGVKRRIENINQAVSMLGRSKLESLVISMAVARALPKEPVLGFNSARFWQAAARRASIARSLADVLHPQSRSESFVAGLLQDMAVPLLATARTKDYGPILEHWHHNPDDTLESLESAEFGWTHTTVGASMASGWELPGKLVTAIGAHHEADVDEAVGPAVRLVGHIRETDEHPGVEALVEACRDEFGLEPDATVRRVDEALAHASQLARMFY